MIGERNQCSLGPDLRLRFEMTLSFQLPVLSFLLDQRLTTIPQHSSSSSFSLSAVDQLSLPTSSHSSSLVKLTTHLQCGKTPIIGYPPVPHVLPSGGSYEDYVACLSPIESINHLEPCQWQEARKITCLSRLDDQEIFATNPFGRQEYESPHWSVIYTKMCRRLTWSVLTHTVSTKNEICMSRDLRSRLRTS